MLIFTLDRVILHNVVHYSLTSTNTEIGKTFCSTDGRTDGQTFDTHVITSTQRIRPKNLKRCILENCLLLINYHRQ